MRLKMRVLMAFILFEKSGIKAEKVKLLPHFGDYSIALPLFYSISVLAGPM